MKRILIILSICFVFTSVYAQMDYPLKQGKPNTMTWSNAEVIYDLNGEWDSFVEPYGPRSGYDIENSALLLTWPISDVKEEYKMIRDDSNNLILDGLWKGNRSNGKVQLKKSDY